MNEIFNFHGQEVRTVTINNEPWFVGKDVADILGYLKPLDAISRHVDEDDSVTKNLLIPGKKPEFINRTFGIRA